MCLPQNGTVYEAIWTDGTFNHAVVRSQEVITDFTHGGARFYFPSQGGISKFLRPQRPMRINAKVRAGACMADESAFLFAGYRPYGFSTRYFFNFMPIQDAPAHYRCRERITVPFFLLSMGNTR